MDKQRREERAKCFGADISLLDHHQVFAKQQTQTSSICNWSIQVKDTRTSFIADLYYISKNWPKCTFDNLNKGNGKYIYIFTEWFRFVLPLLGRVKVERQVEKHLQLNSSRVQQTQNAYMRDYYGPIIISIKINYSWQFRIAQFGQHFFTDSTVASKVFHSRINIAKKIENRCIR